ncbi:MAG: sulfate adenylyltransferase subunit CysN [Acidobacteriaceae bacterium]|nr:sulfate adenylyltransferase subunit CysN [Acidobacteriaceae bacterium]
MDLLRFSTAGSVDDGKSTLIGRLLYDAKGAYEDQLAAIRKNGNLDLALLTDGLRAEREQGITIDVAYRYFATPRRKFIIADTPGHEQYTRNMATGASTADLTIVLIDARKGVLPQSRRHAYIASLLGIPRVAVAINKMDLVGFSEEIYNEIVRDFEEFAQDLGFREMRFFPISALGGDNVVSSSERTRWFDGEPLLRYLETVPAAADVSHRPFRFPVQFVVRPSLDFRGYAGQIASGSIRVGDPLLILPSGRTTTVESIVTYDGELKEAFAPMSVTLTIPDEIDISRGDMLVPPSQPPLSTQGLDASLVWMDSQPMRLGRSYLLKHTTSQMRASVTAIHYRVDVNTMQHRSAEELQLNEIAVVTLETQRPLLFDPYCANRATGSFILIDPVSNATAAAGMIRGVAGAERERLQVTAEERAARYGHQPAIIAVPFEGDLAFELERELFDRGVQVAIVDEIEQARALESAGLIAILRFENAPEGESVGDICASLEFDGIIPSSSR